MEKLDARIEYYDERSAWPLGTGGDVRQDDIWLDLEVMDAQGARAALKRHSKNVKVMTEDMERMRDRCRDRAWVLGVEGGNQTDGV